VRRARARAEDAHLVVHVVRGDVGPNLHSGVLHSSYSC